MRTTPKESIVQEADSRQRETYFRVVREHYHPPQPARSCIYPPKDNNPTGISLQGTVVLLN